MRTLAADMADVGGSGTAFRLSALIPNRRRSRLSRLIASFERFFLVFSVLPETTATLASVVFVAGFAAYGIVLSGSGLSVMDTLTRNLGVAVETVEITGQRQVQEASILETLAVRPGASLFAYDLNAARRRLLQNPWVDSVSLRKYYPGALKVAITERRPYALWQPNPGDPVMIVQKDGAPIIPYRPGPFASLPLVLGIGADQRLDEALKLVRSVPDMASRIKASILVSERRWDLVLDNGLRIMLPENEPARALADVAAMNKTQDIFNRDISLIDLRLPDRVVLRLSDNAKQQRDRMIQERLKAAKGGRT